MEATISTTPPKKANKLKTFLLRGGLSLLGVLVVAQLAWTFSGSNEWEFIGERNAVKIYSLKERGDNVLKFKATRRSSSTLSTMVAVMQDLDIATEVGYIDPVLVEKKSPQHFSTAMRADMPFFFKPREMVTDIELTQDPQTKELLVTVKAAPDLIPPNDCCVRIKNIDNSWRFTPLPNGEIEMEWKVDMDQGGFFPYFLINMVFPEFMYEALPMMQEVMNREKYLHASFDFIQDPSAGAG